MNNTRLTALQGGKRYLCSVNFFHHKTVFTMKNLLMLLFFTVAFAGAEMVAQSSCCTPCPPNCCTAGKASTVDGVAAKQVNQAACCTPEQMKACLPKSAKSNRKADARAQYQSAKAAVASDAGGPAGNEKTACCSKPAALKEEL